MNDQLIKEVKRLDPLDSEEAEQVPPPALLAALMNEERSPAGQMSANRRRLRSVRWLAIPGAVTVVVIAMALPGGSENASPDAVTALRSAAAEASTSPSTPMTGFTYHRLKIATIGTMAAADPARSFSWRTVKFVEQWVAADGSGRVREVTGEPEFVGSADEQDWRALGRPELAGVAPDVVDQQFDPGGLNGPTRESSLPPVHDLPADAEALTGILEDAADDGSVPANAKVFELAAAVLMHAGASPELRSALYEVVAGIEGVTFDGSVSDPLGRPGVAVSLESDYSGAPARYSLIFDPDTSQPLAEVTRLLERQLWMDGSLLGYTILERSGAVSTTRARPGS